MAPQALRLCAQLRERLPPAAEVAPALEPDCAAVLAALGDDALGLDQLALRTALPVATLSSMLLMLELEGEIVATGGAYARRV